MVAFAIGLLIGQTAKSKSTIVAQITAFNFEGTDVMLETKKQKLESVKEKYGPIRNIALLGERNSGTTWMTDELRKCFAASGIDVRSGVTKDKHFFQYDEDYEGDPSYFSHRNAAENKKMLRSSTLVVSVFRNPYAWAAAMQRRPHHSPNHLRLPMEEFLTRPWTMERPQRDLIFSKIEGPVCQLGYAYNEVVPCLRTKHDYVQREGNQPNYSARDPQYELRQDGSGKPFDSILDMREAKIENVMAIESWPWVASLEVLRYEDLLTHGTESFLKYVEDVTGTKMQCTPSPAAPERLSSYKLDPKIKSLIDKTLDWDVEGMIGYSKSKLAWSGIERVNTSEINPFFVVVVWSRSIHSVIE